MFKPAVAFKSEQYARDNIERKIKRFASLLTQGPLQAETPKSLNTFNAWCFKGPPDNEAFVGNAHETLTRHGDLKCTVLSLIELARGLSKPQKPPRELSVQRARERAKVHLILRQIAERQAIEVMLQNSNLIREREALRNQVESMQAESANLQRGYEEEIAKLRQEIAELVCRSGKRIRGIPLNGD